MESILNLEPASGNPPSAEKSDVEQLQAALDREFPPGSEAAPAGDPAAEPAEDLIDENLMRMVLAAPFDYLAARKGDHWKLAPEEMAAILPLAVKVSNKYAPGILKKWGDEFALAGILGIVLTKRVNLDADIAKQKKAEAPAAA